MASKKDREIIYNKFDGKCAYCGDPLQKGWHVDELLPVKRGWRYKKDEFGVHLTDENGRNIQEKYVEHPERFNIDNQMPSCPSCNINKHSGTLDEFRNLIQGFQKHLNEVSTQYKIAKRYGMVEENFKPVVFYFETINTIKQ